MQIESDWCNIFHNAKNNSIWVHNQLFYLFSPVFCSFFPISCCFFGTHWIFEINSTFHPTIAVTIHNTDICITSYQQKNYIFLKMLFSPPPPLSHECKTRVTAKFTLSGWLRLRLRWSGHSDFLDNFDVDIANIMLWYILFSLVKRYSPFKQTNKHKMQVIPCICTHLEETRWNIGIIWW